MHLGFSMRSTRSRKYILVLNIQIKRSIGVQRIVGHRDCVVSVVGDHIGGRPHSTATKMDSRI